MSDHRPSASCCKFLCVLEQTVLTPLGPQAEWERLEWEVWHAVVLQQATPRHATRCSAAPTTSLARSLR